MPNPHTPSEGSSRARTRYNLRTRDTATSAANDEVSLPATPRSRRKVARRTGMTSLDATNDNAEINDVVPEKRVTVDPKVVTSLATTPRTTRRLRSASTDSSLKATSQPGDVPPHRMSTRRKPRPVSAAGSSSGPASATRSAGASKDERSKAEVVKQRERTRQRQPSSPVGQMVTRSNESPDHMKLVKPNKSPVLDADSECRMTGIERTLENIDRWRKADLVLECKRRKLLAIGTKKELKERILAGFGKEPQVPATESGQSDGEEYSTTVGDRIEGVQTRQRSQRSRQQTVAKTTRSKDDAGGNTSKALSSLDGSAVKSQLKDNIKQGSESHKGKGELQRGSGETKGEPTFAGDHSGKGTATSRKEDTSDYRGEGEGHFNGRKDIQGVEGSRIKQSSRQVRGVNAEEQGNIGLGDDSQEKNGHPWQDVKRAAEDITGPSAQAEDSLRPTIVPVKDAVGKRSNKRHANTTNRIAPQEDKPAVDFGNRDSHEHEKASLETGSRGVEPLSRLKQTFPTTRLSAETSQIGVGVTQVGAARSETKAQVIEEEKKTGNSTLEIGTGDPVRPVEKSRANAHEKGHTREAEPDDKSALQGTGQDDVRKQNVIASLTSSLVCGNDEDNHMGSKDGAAKEPSRSLDASGEIARPKKMVSLGDSDIHTDVVSPHGRDVRQTDRVPDQLVDVASSLVRQQTVEPRVETDDRDDARDLTRASIDDLPGGDDALYYGAEQEVYRPRLSESDTRNYDVSSKSHQEDVKENERARAIIVGKGTAEDNDTAPGMQNDRPSMMPDDLAVNTKDPCYVGTQSNDHRSPSQERNEEEIGRGRQGTTTGIRFGESHVGISRAKIAAVETENAAQRTADHLQLSEDPHQSNSSSTKRLGGGGSTAFRETNIGGVMGDNATFPESPLPSPRPFNPHGSVVNILPSTDVEVVQLTGAGPTPESEQDSDSQNEIEGDGQPVELGFGGSEAPDLADALAFSRANAGGRTEVRSSMHLDVTESRLPVASDEEDIHLGSIENTQFETEISFPDTGPGEEGQVAHAHANAEGAVGSGLPASSVIAAQDVVAEPDGEAAENLHANGVSSADELSSLDGEASIGFDGEESGNNGDPVDDVVANDNSSSAGEEDIHSRDSRSSQGADPETAGSDRLSPGASWSSGNPSCPSPRSGASSGQPSDEGSDFGEDTGSAGEGRDASQSRIDEVVNVSSDDEALSPHALPCSDESNVEVMSPRADRVKALDDTPEDDADQQASHELRNIPLEREETVREKAPHDMDMDNKEKRGRLEAVSDDRHLEACEERPDSGSAPKRYAAQDAGKVVELAENKSHILQSRSDPSAAQSKMAVLLPRAAATHVDTHGDVSESLMKDTCGISTEYHRTEAIPPIKALALPTKPLSPSSVPQADPRPPAPSPLLPIQTSGGTVLPARRSGVPPSGVACGSRGERKDIGAQVNDNPDSGQQRTPAKDGPRFSREKRSGVLDTGSPMKKLHFVGRGPALDRPAKRQRIASVLVPVMKMPSPALTLSCVKPTLASPGTAYPQSAAVNRSLDFGPTDSCASAPLLARISRMEEDQTYGQFAAFRDTIRDRMEQRNRPGSKCNSVGDLFHIGSVSRKTKNLSQIGMGTRTKLRILRSRRAWDSQVLAAESLHRTQKMAENVRAWQTAPSPFKGIGESDFGESRSGGEKRMISDGLDGEGSWRLKKRKN